MTRIPRGVGMVRRSAVRPRRGRVRRIPHLMIVRVRQVRYGRYLVQWYRLEVHVQLLRRRRLGFLLEDALQRTVDGMSRRGVDGDALQRTSRGSAGLDGGDGGRGSPSGFCFGSISRGGLAIVVVILVVYLQYYRRGFRPLFSFGGIIPFRAGRLSRWSRSSDTACGLGMRTFANAFRLAISNDRRSAGRVVVVGGVVRLHRIMRRVRRRSGRSRRS